MVAILVMLPGSFEQAFIPPSQGGSTWNLSLIGPMVSEEKMFENVDVRRMDRTKAKKMIFTSLQVPIIWAATWQNQQNDCAPSEDWDQPGHPPSLIRVFAVRLMGS